MSSESSIEINPSPTNRPVLQIIYHIPTHIGVIVKAD